MQSVLVDLVVGHSPGFVFAAVVVCAVAARLVLILSERTAGRKGASLVARLAGLALVAGVGVWTTHFLALLGFRPDVMFAFEPEATFGSAAIAVLLVGVPVAFCAVAAKPVVRALLGACAGVGIAAMHFVGMAALVDCVVTHTAWSHVASAVCGAVVMAAAMAVPHRSSGRFLACFLVVAAVVLVHFTGMAGMTIAPDAVVRGLRLEPTTLGSIVVAVAFALFVVALMFSSSDAKLEEQRRQSGILSVALDNMTNGILLIDTEGRVVLFNGRLLEVLGVPAGSIVGGMRWTEFVEAVSPSVGWTPEHKSLALAQWRERFDNGLAATVERTLADGRVVSTSCRPVPGTGSVFTCIDVTAERETEKRIRHMAFHDALTGLANRRAFRDRLETALSDGGDWTLLLMDLDRFKAVNDTHGHAVGDKLLVEVADRLRDVCGPDDLPARLGGDEMALLMRSGTPQADEAVARAIVEAMSRPFELDDHDLSIGCSIGMATTDDSTDPDALVHCADLALFESKITGRNRARRYRSQTTGMDYLRTLAEDGPDEEPERIVA